jgi:hypothetical protein
MLDIFYDLDIIEPDPYEHVIVTDGENFRSGIWVVVKDKNEEISYFLTDDNGAFDCRYWIPIPKIED